MLVFTSKHKYAFNPMNFHLVSYNETISTNVPPTFRGIYVKYSYKLTIGTQRVNCPTSLIRVPFREIADWS